MRKLNPAISATAFEHGTRTLASPGLGWRQLATVLLLLLTLPVFLVAGAVALAVLPAVLIVVGIGQLRDITRAQLPPAPIHGHR